MKEALYNIAQEMASFQTEDFETHLIYRRFHYVIISRGDLCSELRVTLCPLKKYTLVKCKKPNAPLKIGRNYK